MISTWWLLIIIPASMFAGMVLKTILGEHEDEK